MSFIIRDGSSSQVLQHDQQQAAKRFQNFGRQGDKSYSLFMPADGNRDYLHVEANHQVVLRTRFHPFHTHFATDRPNHFLHRPIGHLGYANPLSTGEGKAGHYSNRYRRSHQFHPELSADSPVLSVWCGHLHFDCRIVRSRRNNSDREEISPYPVHKQAKPTIFPGYSPDNGFSLSYQSFKT